MTDSSYVPLTDEQVAEIRERCESVAADGDVFEDYVAVAGDRDAAVRDRDYWKRRAEAAEMKLKAVE